MFIWSDWSKKALKWSHKWVILYTVIKFYNVFKSHKWAILYTLIRFYNVFDIDLYNELQNVWFDFVIYLEHFITTYNIMIKNASLSWSQATSPTSAKGIPWASRVETNNWIMYYAAHLAKGIKCSNHCPSHQQTTQKCHPWPITTVVCSNQLRP